MMDIFAKQCQLFFEEFKNYKQMVLSTSFEDRVTSRMMSVVEQYGIFYFQADIKSRKYQQLCRNANVALCIDNLQIEGVCEEQGPPLEHKIFCKLYMKYFTGSYDAYSHLKNERVFAVKPIFIQKWVYENTKPFIEILNFEKFTYEKKPYIAE